MLFFYSPSTLHAVFYGAEVTTTRSEEQHNYFGSFITIARNILPNFNIMHYPGWFPYIFNQHASLLVQAQTRPANEFLRKYCFGSFSEGLAGIFYLFNMQLFDDLGKTNRLTVFDSSHGEKNGIIVLTPVNGK